MFQLYFTIYSYQTITLYTLSLYNHLCQITPQWSWRKKKRRKYFVIYMKCSFLLKFFSVPLHRPLENSCPNSETELTTNQQMSLLNWSSTALPCQFQLVIIFSAHFNCLFPITNFIFHFQPLRSLQNPLGLIFFHIACIRTQMKRKCSFWISTQIYVRFTVANWNMFLLCGYPFVGEIKLFSIFFSDERHSFSTWDKHW